ncbi:MAG: tRNA (adenosine(37)-N6)-threonylcarbamoyltransferase complex dimerization subunit type 1 TsaB [Cyanobacteriota bacterium]|nr:tRNA (adenosine(37)-N6)-threonylcarbamoyltransferase complex dimerization subunit type 1 TsaB [Cyanobacteriota bacterium]
MRLGTRSAGAGDESRGWVLALHSSSDCLGVALQPLGQPETPARVEAFPLGRGLSNNLLSCVEAVLPAREWPQLARLAVATGPGGFTGTRLTVAMARTLAQQLDLPLDGISSFHLIARRLLAGQPNGTGLILCQDLPRHGVVAGLYQAETTALAGVAELCAPRLWPSEQHLSGALGPHARHTAQPLLPADAVELLAFSQEAARSGREAPWASVVPLYPTSPVEQP